MAAARAVPSPPPYDVTMEESKHKSNDHHMHTPPASDMSSHGRKEDDDDDDAASSSELSDLDDQFEGGPQPSFAQDVPMEDVPAIVEPDRYEGGIPIFQPVCYEIVPLDLRCCLSFGAVMASCFGPIKLTRYLF